MGIPAAVKAAVKNINDRYGDGTIARLGDSGFTKVERLLTGIEPLDEMLGGGLPKGSFIELYGEPSSGKSTIAQIIVALAQKKGLTCAYTDAEHGLDEDWMKRFGINLEDLVWSQSSIAEEVLDSALELTKANIDIAIIDSVSALTPKEELEGVEEEGMEDKKVAILARVMSKGCRIINHALKKKNTVLIFINQFTTNIGAAASFFGIPLKTKGGLALKQYARVRLEVIRTEWITSSAAEKHGVKYGRIGAKVEVRVTKSKVSPPFKYCRLNLTFYTPAQLAKMGVRK